MSLVLSSKVPKCPQRNHATTMNLLKLIGWPCTNCRAEYKNEFKKLNDKLCSLTAVIQNHCGAMQSGVDCQVLIPGAANITDKSKPGADCLPHDLQHPAGGIQISTNCVPLDNIVIRTTERNALADVERAVLKT